MKKFLIITLAAIFLQMTPSLAKEVYVGTEDGLEFFVETNSIDYIQGNMFYVTVNEYSGDDLYDSTEWKFYNEHFNGRGKWFFDYYYLGKRNLVSSYKIAGKVLNACRIYETRISM